MSPNEFRAEVTRRGWTYVELGERWAITPNWLTKLAANVERPAHWDDAVRGLPVKTK